MSELLSRIPAWALVAGYLGAWLAIAVIVRLALKRWLSHLAKRKKTPFTEILAGTLPRPAAIAIFLIGLSAGLRWLPVSADVSADVRRVFPVLTGVLAIMLLMLVGFRSIDAYGRLNPSLRSTAGIGRAALWVIGLAAIALVICDALGISLAPALTALGVGSLAFALALQDTFSNFFSGIYLLADKPVSPGEFIRIDTGFEGYVEAIGWRTTQLRTLANNIVIVPNATLSKAVITNFSRPDPSVAIEVRVDVGLEADVDKVETLLHEEALRAPDIEGVRAEPPPYVRFSPGYVEGALAFTIVCYVSKYESQGRVQHEVRKRVMRRLKAEGIALPALRVK